MKRQVTSLFIVSAVLSGSLFAPVEINEAHAAVVQQNMTVKKEMVLVEGMEKSVSFIEINKIKLHSVQELAKMMSASITYNQKTKTYTITKGIGKNKKTIQLTQNSNVYVANGKKSKLGIPAKLEHKTLFVQVTPLVKALGGDILTDKNLLISVNGSFKLGSSKLMVDGTGKQVNTFTVNGKQLYSVQDISKLFSATTTIGKNNEITLSKQGKTLKFKLLSKVLQNNGTSMKLVASPVHVKGIVYADLNDIVTAFGGDVQKLNSSLFVATSGLVSGDTFAPQFINEKTLLVTNNDRSVLLDTQTKKASWTINATDLIVSPNGKKAVYSDETGFMHLVDFETKMDTVVNAEDDSLKVEFVWSSDGTKVYFLQGDKNEKISYMTITDGKVTKVFEDKLTYKSDLHLSFDGKKVLYVVGKEGTTKYTDDDKTDVDSIDLTGTEPQIYSIDLESKEVKADQLTTTNDNKVFSMFLKNAGIVYLSAKTDSEELPELKILYGVDETTVLVKNKDIISSLVTPQGKLVILVAEENSMSTLYEVNTDTKGLRKLAQTNLPLTSFTISPDGKSLVATTPGEDGEIVVVWKNGQFEALTKNKGANNK